MKSLSASTPKDTMQLADFLQKSPTSFHACENIKDLLKQHGFSELDEQKKWKLERSKNYFVIRGGALLAFCLPKKRLASSTIIAAHTDSPGLKMKPQGEFEKEDLALLSFEVYGSPILASFVGRDLGLAGRIFYQQKDEVKCALVFYDTHPIIIPNLAIHLDRTVNESGLVLNKQEHLAAVCGAAGATFLDTLFKDKTVLHTELFAVPLEAPRFFGKEGELLAAYRLDNLVSCHAALFALLNAKSHDETMSACVFWNHEEVGSETNEGAASSFLNDVLCRVNDLLGQSKEDFFTLKANSKTVSVDVAHGVHPNYSDKSEVRHKALLGSGIAIKLNAQERYSSSGPVLSSFLAALKKAKIPTQTYLCRGDIPCGSTVGPLQAAKTGIQSIDIGIPLLGMHAAREVIHMDDYAALVAALKVLFR